MSKQTKSSISIVKIICVSLILLALSGFGAIAMATQMNTVTITLPSGYELTVLTNKTKVSEILENNNICIGENEKVTPNLEDEITSDKSIVICDKSIQEIQVAKVSENGIQTSLEEILDNYAPITEKIVVENVEIPFETITKDVSNNSGDTKNKVIVQGENGIKEVTYKIKYKNNEEIERNVISEKITKEPINKIVQVQANITTRSSTTSRNSQGTRLFKVTAYCPCTKCCGKYASGYTASGTKATAGRTIAASKQFAFGTKLLINGTVYTVEDRGGAIQGDKIDIYCDSHQEALIWGVKYLPVQVVE